MQQNLRSLVCGLLVVFPQLSFSQRATPLTSTQNGAYLFVYFTGNDRKQEQIRFAISTDAHHFIALNNNLPIIKSSHISSSGGVRDPHILRREDNKGFYMVVTDMASANGWNSNRAMILLKSENLIDWQSAIVNIPNRFAQFEDVDRVWAPQTIYDSRAKKYVIYWSMHTEGQPDKIYYAYANNDFTDLETAPKQLFHSPTNNACIDADIIEFNGKYNLFFKTEDQRPGIKKAVSDSLTGGYVLTSNDYLQQTTDPVEGSGIFRLNGSNDFILMYDVYTKGKYQFTKSSDLENFKVIDDDVKMNFHPRHGSVLPITQNEAQTLISKWLSPNDVMLNSVSASVKEDNISLDSTNHKLYLQVKTRTNLKSFNPEFVNLPGVNVTPGQADFTKGPVTYTVTIEGQKPIRYQVYAKVANNKVLDGYFADPDIIYSEKTQKFYIYPTSDGFNGWSGTYFKSFSSTDLTTWKDEGVILDLTKDVRWAKRNAWAPCITETKRNGQYKYFYYFCAEQKIGVAVADNPTGPFIDSGKPLINKLPDGVTGGQQIDPDIFTDPKTGKTYLYWGNGYMAGAELNDDLVSINPHTTKILTPDDSFREGATVLYRNGTYYFMWSEGDTRSPDYRVRYGTSDSPLGKISIPANNIVIEKNKETGIYGTGHNAVIQIPGKDEWYLVYHRFNYPNGITWGDAAGFNREVCIDKLEFNADGSIRQVIPTHEGIIPVQVKKK